jgi:hypothetical protein
MAFPTKKYERLYVLQRQWQLPQEDMFYAIEDSMLRVCIWLPLRYMEIGTIKNRQFIHESHEHIEGFVGVRAEDCHTIFSKGRTGLRRFHSIAKTDQMLRLSDEPPQPTISVRYNDLVVLQKDKESFEKLWELNESNDESEETDPQNFSHSNDYRHIILNGIEFRLGDNQAKILAMLHDATQSRNPWVHGKTLIYESGVTAPRLRDVFKHRADWRDLIISDNRGYYRLNVPLKQPQDQQADCIIKSENANQKKL